jgi:hypothetical protein
MGHTSAGFAESSRSNHVQAMNFILLFRMQDTEGRENFWLYTKNQLMEF